MMTKVSDLFYIFSGSKLDFGKQIESKDGINFVSRNSNNNGVVGRILLQEKMNVFESGDITVPLGGSFLLSCFVQNEPFVTAQNVHVLRPKNQRMSLEEKWFYCYALRLNRFKFVAFGREVNKYLKDIEIPEYVPKWVKSANYKSLKSDNQTPISLTNITLWKKFLCKDLFEIERGGLSNLNDLPSGETPVVSAYGNLQGVQYYCDVPCKYSNTLTISFNGSGTGYCAYHEYGFNANSDCGVLMPKFLMNKYIGIFLATCINYFSYKYMYGRKMSKGRLENEEMILPIDAHHKPDFKYMEEYIKSLPNGDLL